MSITLTENEISQRLSAAIESAGEGSDGYAELELNAETRLKCAAVLVPLVWQDDEWHLLFTRRTDKVESHKGQVSFPGGACDEGEATPEQTALRETNEEIGLQAKDIKVLGRLTNLITISYFRVTPALGDHGAARALLGNHRLDVDRELLPDRARPRARPVPSLPACRGPAASPRACSGTGAAG